MTSTARSFALVPRSRVVAPRVALVAALVLAGAVLGASPASAAAADDSGRVGVYAPAEGSRVGTAAAGPAPRLRATASTPDRLVQRVTLKWNGSWKKPRYQRSAVVPGIGRLELVCSPQNTAVRLYATERDAETQMWMAKHEVKNKRNVVAVKTARIYRYAHAYDDGTGGTGSSAQEGLNQRSSIENYSSGYLDGVISQRPSRNRAAAGVDPKPVTSFRLNWYWNGFDYPAKYRFCQFDAVLKTTFPTRLGVNWHGERDAIDNTLQVTRLASLGTLHLRCGTDDDGGGGIQSLSLVPHSRSSRVYAEIISGEGDVEDHIDQTSLGYDPESGRVGPVPLPRNGMMRVFFTVDGTTRPFIVSSYHVTNNNNPALNLCELAVAPY